jgi:hypothetical protein
MKQIKTTLLALLAMSAAAFADIGTIYVQAPPGTLIYIDGHFVGKARGSMCYFVSDGFLMPNGDSSGGWNSRSQAVTVQLGPQTKSIIVTRDKTIVYRTGTKPGSDVDTENAVKPDVSTR